MLRSLITSRFALCCSVGVLLALLVAAARPCAAESLRVMTFNLWQGGEEGKQPLAQSVKVIEAAKADLVGLQETAGLERGGRRPDNARRIAEIDERFVGERFRQRAEDGEPAHAGVEHADRPRVQVSPGPREARP